MAQKLQTRQQQRSLPIGQEIEIDELSFLMNRFAEEQQLSDASIQLLLGQIDSLRDIYGRYIDKAHAYQIIAKQWEVTQTGYIQEPVDIVEFVESPQYMNQGAYIRPVILENLYNLFDKEDQFYEVVLGGAIGIGKNYFADMAVSYILYKMSCLLSPQAHYGLAPGSEIVFVHQSKTLQLARKVVFNQFAGRLRASGYFPKHFSFSSTYRAQMNFPNNISVIPISSSDTAALGMNIFTAVLDELNFMTRIKRARATVFDGEGDYDQAMKLYSEIYGRVESRYMSLGRVPGKIFLISSANYEGDFISRKEDEQKEELKNTGETHIYVMHLSQWEALPPERFGGKKFWVMLPTDKFKGRLLDEEPASKAGVVAIPVEYKKSFSLDLYSALRAIGGMAVARHNRVLDTGKIEEAFTGYEIVYGEEQIFSNPSMVFDETEALEPILNLDFLRKIRHQGPFGAHADLGITNSSAGIAIGHVVGSKDIGTRTVFNTSKGRFVKEAYGDLPIYSMAGLLKIDPPSNGGEIDLNAIRDMFFLIGEYIPLKWVTFDRFQSAALIQSFRARKIASYVVSVDKSPQAYMESKHAFSEQRVLAPRHEFFEEEASELEQDAVTGKVSHLANGSKDVADAVASVIFEFSKKRTSYRKKGAPVKLSGEDTTTPRSSEHPTVTIRPSSGRELLY